MRKKVTSVTIIRTENPSVRTHDAPAEPSTCRHCGAPIERSPLVGWIDLRTPYYDGTYDMCPCCFCAAHEPAVACPVATGPVVTAPPVRATR